MKEPNTSSWGSSIKSVTLETVTRTSSNDERKKQKLFRKRKENLLKPSKLRKHVTFLEPSACVTYSPDDSRNKRQSQSNPSPVALNVKEMTWNERNTNHETNKLCLSILNFSPNFFINALTKNEIIFYKTKRKDWKIDKKRFKF